MTEGHFGKFLFPTVSSIKMVTEKVISKVNAIACCGSQLIPEQRGAITKSNFNSDKTPNYLNYLLKKSHFGWMYHESRLWDQ